MVEIFGYKNLYKACKPIEKFINKNIDKDIKIIFRKESASDIEDKVAYVGLTPFITMTRADTIHKKLYEEKGLDFTEIDYKMFALLHEIGHIVVGQDYEDLDRKLRDYKMAQENFKINFPYATDEINFRHYMELELEKDADKWALDYYTKNRDSILKFQKRYLKVINKMINKVVN